MSGDRIHVTLGSASSIDSERALALMALGVLQAIQGEAMTPEQGCAYFFVPALLQLREHPGASADLMDALHSAAELEDVRKHAPQAVESVMDGILRKLLSAVERCNEQESPLGMRLVEIE